MTMLALVDYRRHVHELYARVRAAGSAAPTAFADFVATRNALFARHAASPLAPERRAAFGGLQYHLYDPRLRFVVAPDLEVPRTRLEVRLAADGLVVLERFAQVTVPFVGGPERLSLYWIGGYGGGLFLPFRDATSGVDTYGGGRYLLDTLKGADLGVEVDDLGVEGAALVLDFNYAYQPSCAYDPRWDCPLAPPENRLSAAVSAGERFPWREAHVVDRTDATIRGT